MPTVKEQIEALNPLDRSARVGRTMTQAGTSAALVTVVEYVTAYLGADLDPWADGTQQSFPQVFTGALFVLGASVLAWWMNRDR